MHTFTLLTLISAFILQSVAVPIDGPAGITYSTLQKRSKCGDGFESPCVCGGTIGLRYTSAALEKECRKFAFLFEDRSDKPDGTLKGNPIANREAAGTDPLPDCDHIVETQFIALQIEDNPAACKKLAKPGVADELRKGINSVSNTVFLEKTVNGAKGVLFATKTKQKDGKATAGVASYLKLIGVNDKSGKPTTFLDQALTEILIALDLVMDVQGNIRQLRNKYDAFVDVFEKIVNKAEDNAADLGGTHSTTEACTPPSKREVFYSIVKRLLTGKTTPRGPCFPSAPGQKKTATTTTPGSPTLGRANTLQPLGRTNSLRLPVGANPLAPPPLAGANAHAPPPLAAANAFQAPPLTRAKTFPPSAVLSKQGGSVPASGVRARSLRRQTIA